MIHIRPAREKRVAFARWAVAQRPKLRTVTEDTFAVPPYLFVDAPEDILIGAYVDGHRYVSPDEDRAAGRERPSAPQAAVPEPAGELLGVASPDALTAAPAPATADADSTGGDGLVCDVCARAFTTTRGRDTHRRQAHPED